MLPHSQVQPTHGSTIAHTDLDGMSLPSDNNEEGGVAMVCMLGGLASLELAQRADSGETRPVKFNGYCVRKMAPRWHQGTIAPRALETN